MKHLWKQIQIQRVNLIMVVTAIFCEMPVVSLVISAGVNPSQS